MSYDNFQYTYDPNHNGETTVPIVPQPTYDRIDPRLNSTYNPPPTQDKNDEQWIETWLLQKHKLDLTGNVTAITYEDSNVKPKLKNDIPIHIARESLKKCLEIMKRIDATQTDLERNVNTMSSVEWKQKTVDIGLLKDDFNKLMAKFEDDKSITGLRRAIKKREKKRQTQKLKRNAKSEIWASENEKRLKLHKKIDNWLDAQKEEVEKAKLEEKKKKDADCILDEVTKKRSEARKHLSLIFALVKLRTVRENMKTQRGEKTSLEDRKAFGLVTEKLVRMWESLLEKYTNEEQTMQNMLKDNANDASKAKELAKENSVIEEWNKLLFGDQNGQHLNNSAYWAFTNAERDLETFIAIRKSWDTFLTSPNHELGSKIPIGWVLPPTNSTNNWLKYLEH